MKAKSGIWRENLRGKGGRSPGKRGGNAELVIQGNNANSKSAGEVFQNLRPSLCQGDDDRN